ncbi:MAG: amidohydrolase family protein [Acidobacteria bacterium]|nr:amidohydrolase family protein [Acidobacteriota bacterium]
MRRPARYFFLLFFFWIAPVAAVAQTEQPAALVIEGGTLIDGNGGEPVGDALIVIRGNRIETVSRRGQASYPAGARVLHADGKFILPGLMDAHTHYAGWMTELFLAHGVTTVFSIGSGGEWAVAHREAIDRGKIPGPRTFVAAGNVLETWGAGTAQLSGSQVASITEKARAAAKRIIALGADMINVQRGLPVEAWEAIVEEAHQAGLPVVAQPIGPWVYAREAVLAGVDILEHAAGVGYALVKDPSLWREFGRIESHSLDPTPFADMDEAKAAELIQLMVERNVYLEPDFIAMGRGFHKERARFELEDYRLFQNPGLAYIPVPNRQRIMKTYREFDGLEPDERDRRRKGYQNMLRFIRQFARAGGKVMAGTDTSGWAVPGLGLHHELELLVEEAGFSPMEAIVAATRTPAEGFRQLDRVGTIETGKLADLLIVNEDPLQNIRNINIQKIEWVIKNGEVVDRTYHAWWRDPLPRGDVEGRDWVAALKRRTQEGIRTRSGLQDPAWAFGQPTPGIESISPTMVTEGDSSLTLTIRGVNFTDKSLVLFDNRPVPARLVSETELSVSIDAELLARVGTFPVFVRNPGFQQQPQWGGDASNRAYLLVNFRY